MEHNAIGWVEIPVTDMERAMRFYETVFDLKLERHQVGPLDMAWFPMVENKMGSAGSLVKHERYVPSQEGVLVYFMARSGDLANELSRVEKASGRILQEKKPIGEHGFVGVILDTEGNRIALHSMK